MSSQCHRCLKITNSVHTCTPTAEFGALELRMAELEAERDSFQAKLLSQQSVLQYLMQQFNGEVWNCPACGYAESTQDCDSAEYLREYLYTKNDLAELKKHDAELKAQLTCQQSPESAFDQIHNAAVRAKVAGLNKKIAEIEAENARLSNHIRQIAEHHEQAEWGKVTEGQYHTERRDFALSIFTSNPVDAQIQTDINDNFGASVISSAEYIAEQQAKNARARAMLDATSTDTPSR